MEEKVLTINEIASFKRLAQNAQVPLKKIKAINSKIDKLNEEKQTFLNELKWYDQRTQEMFGKDLVDVMVVEHKDGKTVITFNPKYFDVQDHAYTDKTGRIVHKNSVTFKGTGYVEDATVSIDDAPQPITAEEEAVLFNDSAKTEEVQLNALSDTL